MVIVSTVALRPLVPTALGSHFFPIKIRESNFIATSPVVISCLQKTAKSFSRRSVNTSRWNSSGLVRRVSSGLLGNVVKVWLRVLCGIGPLQHS